MRTGEAAKILGIDRTTIYNWADMPQLKKYFSTNATGEDGSTQRLLTEADVLVLNTIRIQRAKGNRNWDDIAQMLESGYRDREFPQNAISGDPRTIPLPQAEQSAKAVATMAERDGALARVEELTEQVRELSIKLAESEKARYEDREKLLREIGEMRHQIGRLEGQLEMYRDGRAKPDND